MAVMENARIPPPDIPSSTYQTQCFVLFNAHRLVDPRRVHFPGVRPESTCENVELLSALCGERYNQRRDGENEHAQTVSPEFGAGEFGFQVSEGCSKEICDDAC